VVGIKRKIEQLNKYFKASRWTSFFLFVRG